MFLTVIVMVMAAVAIMVVIMVMTAVAIMVVIVVMTAVAIMAVIVMMTAVTTVVVIVMVVSTMAPMVLVVPGGRMGTISGSNYHTMLYGPGEFGQFRNQYIRILCGQPQMPGGKGDGSFLDHWVGVEFGFDFGCAVCAVQIIDDVYFLCHWIASYIFTYEQLFMCYNQYTSI